MAANGYARQDTPAEVALDLTGLLTQVGSSAAINLASLRVVEVDAGGAILDDAVPFQFDPAPGFDPAANASGTLIILVTGASGAGAERDYQLYFDDVNGPPVSAAPVTNLVQLTDDVQDAGQASYQIDTAVATYFFHKDGGGFSSLLDNSANDWIDHNDNVGSAGDFRGIPNIAHPDDGGYFHPGAAASAAPSLVRER